MGRIQKHNKELVDQAEYRAGQMQVWPSVLEERMKLKAIADITKNNVSSSSVIKYVAAFKCPGQISRNQIQAFIHLLGTINISHLVILMNRNT